MPAISRRFCTSASVIARDRHLSGISAPEGAVGRRTKGWNLRERSPLQANKGIREGEGEGYGERVELHPGESHHRGAGTGRAKTLIGAACHPRRSPAGAGPCRGSAGRRTASCPLRGPREPPTGRTGGRNLRGTRVENHRTSTGQVSQFVACQSSWCVRAPADCRRADSVTPKVSSAPSSDMARQMSPTLTLCSRRQPWAPPAVGNKFAADRRRCGLFMAF